MGSATVKAAFESGPKIISSMMKAFFLVKDLNLKSHPKKKYILHFFVLRVPHRKTRPP